MNVWLLHWSLQKHHWLELGSLTRSWSCHQKSESQWNIFQFNVRLIIEACKLFIFMHLTARSVMNVGKRHLLHNLDMNWIEEADWWWLRLWIPQDSDVWYDFIIHQPSETTSAIFNNNDYDQQLSVSDLRRWKPQITKHDPPDSWISNYIHEATVNELKQKY